MSIVRLDVDEGNHKMKFMKLGTRPDIFFAEDATRTMVLDVPSDLTIQVNNITYLLHKFPLLPKSGLLRRLCSDDSRNSRIASLELHDIPGGNDAFELCAKFCYGITINLSAQNFVSALCAAKFLQMTEAIEKGNFVTKLEAFFSSCILEGWKDSIFTLQSTGMLPKWSENVGIVRRCIDSIVEKILTPPEKVTWSFSYTRPGYDRHQYVPMDWWTEDIANLDINLFGCIISSLRSSNIRPSKLIGEAIHVYACQWLPDTTSKNNPAETSSSQSAESVEKKQRILETIVSMIPGRRGSVSIRFLLRLLSTTFFLGGSPVTKAELIRRSGQQFEEATIDDLLLVSNSSSSDHGSYDVDIIETVLESFSRQWRRRSTGKESENSARKVGKLIDRYLQLIAKDVNISVQKIVYLAEGVPEIARIDHDELYKAIDIYLKEHPDISKADKKQLCRVLDCQNLSPEIQARAMKNDRLPLRTVVQLLYFEQEKAKSYNFPSPDRFPTKQQLSVPQVDLNRVKLRAPGEQSGTRGVHRYTKSEKAKSLNFPSPDRFSTKQQLSVPQVDLNRLKLRAVDEQSGTRGVHKYTKSEDFFIRPRLEADTPRKVVAETAMEKRGEFKRGHSGSRGGSGHIYGKGRER